MPNPEMAKALGELREGLTQFGGYLLAEAKQAPKRAAAEYRVLAALDRVAELLQEQEA